MFSKRSLTRCLLIFGMLALCARAGGAAASDGKGGDFTLNAPDGPLSLSDLRGKVVLIFFWLHLLSRCVPHLACAH